MFSKDLGLCNKKDVENQGEKKYKYSPGITKNKNKSSTHDFKLMLLIRHSSIAFIPHSSTRDTRNIHDKFPSSMFSGQLVNHSAHTPWAKFKR